MVGFRLVVVVIALVTCPSLVAPRSAGASAVKLYRQPIPDALASRLRRCPRLLKRVEMLHVDVFVRWSRTNAEKLYPLRRWLEVKYALLPGLPADRQTRCVEAELSRLLRQRTGHAMLLERTAEALMRKGAPIQEHSGRFLLQYTCHHSAGELWCEDALEKWIP